MYRLLALAVLCVYTCLCTGLASAEEFKALRMIVVRDKPEAEQIVQQLRQGASFSALAGSKSIGPERRSWGYSGTVRVADIQPELRQALQKLQPGQISDILEVGRNFVIIKVIAPQIERHYAAADDALRKQQTAQAVQELKAALRLEEDNVQTHLKLAMLYDQAKRYEEAIPHLDKAQQYAPQSTQIVMLRAAVYTHAALPQKNRMHAQKALQAYETVLQLDRSLAPAVHFGIGKVHLLVLEQPDTAIAHLEKAVRTTPNVPEVYGLLIQAYYDTQRYDKAWHVLRLAQSLGIEFPKLRDALHKAEQQKQR